jgi:putative flippase GtrA
MRLFKNPTIIQFIKFGLVGVSNTAISLTVYYLFVWINPELYLVGSTVGAIVSIANSFYWNNKYVFSSKRMGALEVLVRLGKTYISYGVTFVLGITLLYIEVDVLGLSVVLCPLANRAITIPLNFLLNKYWTFRQPKR